MPKPEKEGLMDRKKNAVVREFRKFQKKECLCTHRQEDPYHDERTQQEQVLSLIRRMQRFEELKEQRQEKHEQKYGKKMRALEREYLKKLAKKKKLEQRVMNDLMDCQENEGLPAPENRDWCYMETWEPSLYIHRTPEKDEEEQRANQLLRAKWKEDKRKEEALQKYIEKKREISKKLSRKTKWGQPVMSGRIEILLEKIQSVNIKD